MELGELETEIVRTLLDNDETRKNKVIDISEQDGSTYVTITRSRGSVIYKRNRRYIVRRATGDEEKEITRLIRRKHPMATSAVYERETLEHLKKDNTQGLKGMIDVLNSNGHTITKVIAHYFPYPFDTRVVLDTIRNKANASRLYIVETAASYARADASFS